MSAVRGRRGGPAGDGRPRRGGTGSRPARAAGPGRPAGRPAQRRPGRTAGTRADANALRPFLTGRAVLLGALVLLLALTLAGPVRQYTAGRAELARLAAEGTALDDRVQELQAQLERQSDPAYIRQQATARLSYVLPGDRLVVVADGQTVDGTGPVDPPTGDDAGADTPWYDGLMESLAAADG